jgi:Domain of unknown function (DUF1905)
MDVRLKSAKLTALQPTIRFKARLAASLLPLPKAVEAKLPRDEVVVEATINGFPFRAALEPGGGNGHCLKVNHAMLDAAGDTWRPLPTAR